MTDDDEVAKLAGDYKVPDGCKLISLVRFHQWVDREIQREAENEKLGRSYDDARTQVSVLKNTCDGLRSQLSQAEARGFSLGIERAAERLDIAAEETSTIIAALEATQSTERDAREKIQLSKNLLNVTIEVTETFLAELTALKEPAT